ncbi:hypothetical protein U8527_20495 [Kordia algicida OT-1]|uniref:DUF4177 domain-containing protein n=1 Tax=Kordia algicida OT-1 TaxID=391587 RepID=A9DKR0_9FLAO|nr:hypothetical protein [Kordia algicida]EDP98381.1 hypothetical protein KAOT1_14227 [Kordia algicida OT-1]
MEYKVVPFVPSVSAGKESANHVPSQLEDIIKNYSDQGWTYVSLESVTTVVHPETGCFGLGAKPGYTTTRQMIVFSK